MPLMEDKIIRKLEEAFHPTYLKVVNQSIAHKGHAGDDGSGESHFDVEIESEKLKGLSRVHAQRAVYDVLKNELEIVHALSLKIKT